MKRLLRRQRACLPYLLTGLSLEEVSRQSGVGYATLRRYLADPAFVCVLNELLDAQITDASQQVGIALAAAGPDAVATIKEILGDKGIDKEVRLRAATACVDRLLRIAEFQQTLAQKENRIRESY